MSDGFFDETVAATYDQDVATDPHLLRTSVDLLAELAGPGPVLEFAVGTGRLALPLAERGLSVSGIEMSRAMASRLLDKPGGAAIHIEFGDMTETRLEGLFSLVFLAFNTIENLTTQDAQVACFENAARHLMPGGAFLVEVGVPPLQRLPLGERLVAFERIEGHWGMDEIDVVSQRFSSHHVWFKDGASRSFSVPFRYVWPAELDLMARIAGLSLDARWGGWSKEPFTATSPRHVSVWRKPAA